MSTAIVWFRQDLRCQDNPALSMACQQHEMIIPLYVRDNVTHIGAAQHWWLHHSLTSLQKTLGTLCLKTGVALEQIKALISQHQVEAIYWNRCYESASIIRDIQIKEELQAYGLQVISLNGSLLNEPWKIKTQSGSNFKVFTSYWKQCLRQMQMPNTYKLTKKIQSPQFESEDLASWSLLPKNPNWTAEFNTFWQPGENGAINKLDDFLLHFLKGYKEQRDLPAASATSKLSPHLHFGEISPWQIWRAIEEAKKDPDCDLASAERFLTELGWREFSYHLLYYYPDLPSKNFRKIFDNFPSQCDQEALSCWQQGLTGFPIVDAGMRELWRTGYMHNRVRMIVASFLVKDLFIDWREGAAWFLDTLLDADLANNSASWQWVAGSGADAAPYFRIFNPVLQGEKFDPLGIYIRHWLPELTEVKTRWIHKPWLAPANDLAVQLGKDYPYPLINHEEARKLALAHYQALKKPNDEKPNP